MRGTGGKVSFIAQPETTRALSSLLPTAIEAIEARRRYRKVRRWTHSSSTELNSGRSRERKGERDGGEGESDEGLGEEHDDLGPGKFDGGRG